MGSVTLPPAAWRDRAGLARVIDALEPGTTRIVGGAVRDTLLGIDTADVDLATTHAPEAVVDLLEAVRIKAVPTGIQHGTITAVANDEVYEVTTLRRDLDTDGRHATVAFTDDWREDAARRDFTINALYADPASGELFDYFGGIADLEAHRVCFIGDPLTRIAEDHLRILRFFRFLARFGDAPDAEGLKACTDRANDLMALSRERIANELLRLLIAPRAPEVVALMIEHGIFVPVLPMITDETALKRLVSLEARWMVEPNAIRRLAALLPHDRKVATTVAAQLKLSKKQRERLENATDLSEVSKPYELAYLFGADTAIDRLLLAGINPTPLLSHSRPAFTIKGGQLVTMGIDAGPDVARTLRKIERRWIEEGFPDASRLDHIANEEVAQVLADIRKS